MSEIIPVLADALRVVFIDPTTNELVDKPYIMGIPDELKLQIHTHIPHYYEWEAPHHGTWTTRHPVGSPRPLSRTNKLKGVLYVYYADRVDHRDRVTMIEAIFKASLAALNDNDSEITAQGSA